MAIGESFPFIYQDGFTFKAIAHRPPPPFGHRHYGTDLPDTLPPCPTPSESQLDYVLKHHPIMTEPVQNPRQITLKIVRQITNSESKGARVFVCKMRPDRRQKGSTDLVFAKVYDALYYSYACLGIGSVKSPVFFDSDRDYSREAAAYEHLRRTGHDGEVAPAYYGSWTFDAPTDRGSRPVRLIVTEYVPAPSLYQDYYHIYVPNTYPKQWIPPNERADLSDGFRLHVLAKIMEICCRQLHLGLNQADVAPRNVIALLTGQKDDRLDKESVQRVVLVDYNNSFLGPRKYAMDYRKNKLPPHPMQMYWDGGPSKFEDWMPTRWRDEKRLRHKWLYATFGRSRSYEPISRRVEAEVATLLNEA